MDDPQAPAEKLTPFQLAELTDRFFAGGDPTTFCYDHFKSVYRTFAPAMPSEEKVARLLDHCQKTETTEALLAALAEYNTGTYQAVLAEVKQLSTSQQLVGGIKAKLDRLRRRSPRLILAGGLGLLVLIGLAVWLITAPSRAKAVLYIGPTCQPSTEPLKVGVAELPNCAPEFRDQLLSAWAAELVLAEPINQPFSTVTEAQRQTGYDLVLAGQCAAEAEGAADGLFYALPTTRKPDEIYEPAVLTTTANLAETTALGAALISYQLGRYDQAISQFATLAGGQTGPERAILSANSLLFARRHEPAIEVYEELILTLPPPWQAVAYNNLGMTRFNQDFSQPVGGIPSDGLLELDQAIRLAKESDNEPLQLLALVNRSDILRRAGEDSWGRAGRDPQADCSAAAGLDRQSPLVYICQIYVALESQPRGSQTLLTTLDDLLGQVQVGPDTPAKFYYLQADYYYQADQKAESLQTYEQFLAKMENRACLETDFDRVSDLVEYILPPRFNRSVQVRE